MLSVVTTWPNIIFMYLSGGFIGYVIAMIKYSDKTKCPTCKGTGYKPRKSLNETGSGCPDCGGGPTRVGTGLRTRNG